ncbi:MAG TPA: BrnT family toxin [Rhizomicrobium sp.]
MGNVAVAGFDWDEGNLTKCAKHGVTVEEIEAFFLAGPAVAPDPAHSALEDRLIAVGRTAQGRALFVAFTLRQKQDRRLIRPVSARYMHKKEIKAYEKESSQTQK